MMHLEQNIGYLSTVHELQWLTVDVCCVSTFRRRHPCEAVGKRI